jgi:FtsH-binding integral membrane protein
MVDDLTLGARGYAPAREISTAALLGQVLFLVAVAIGFVAIGSLIGRDLSQGAALAFSLGGFGMLMISSFGGERFRVGGFAMGWLFATALVIGIGLAPALDYYISADPEAFTQAAAGTALTVVLCGCGGLIIARDLARWMRPVALIVFVAALASWVLVLVNGSLSPVVSVVIYGFSALLLVIDFNYIRRHGAEDDVVWLATGIFVSIVNIFLSLLNLFSR